MVSTGPMSRSNTRSTCIRARWSVCASGLWKRASRRPLLRKEQKNRKANKIDGRAEAHLVALACSEPPEGRRHWTLKLLAGRLVALELVDSVSPETVRKTLKKTS